MTDSPGVAYAFQGFEHGRLRQVGRLDREVRRPDLLVAWARKRGLLPPAAGVVLVTGSKGKGTLARLVAWGESGRGAAGPVGLLLSPEECGHLDRIRIDNKPISASEFDAIIDAIRPELDELAQAGPADFYLSPTAVFLAVALVWWHRRGVRRVVIEGGRGAQWDEIGQIDARLAVVTSVLPEHLARLGPTLVDVAADKFSLVRRCDTLLCPRSLQVWAEQVIPATFRSRLSYVDMPLGAASAGWYPQLHALASQACSLLAGAAVTLPQWPVPSLISLSLVLTPDGRRCDCRVSLDGAVLPECLLPRLTPQALAGPAAVVLGLADDKDCQGLLAALTGIVGLRLFAVRLCSPLNHVRSDWLDSVSEHITCLGELDVVAGVTPRIDAALQDLIVAHRSVLFVGVQTFLRSVRTVLRIGPLGPTSFVKATNG